MSLMSSEKEGFMQQLDFAFEATVPHIDPEWKQDWKSVKATKSSNNSDLAAYGTWIINDS